MSQPLRIIFAGTPDFAARHLEALIDSHHQIVGVFTQPDRPAGRGHKLIASPVKQLAEQHNIAVYQPKTLRQEEGQKMVSELNADLMVVVAYGLILPQVVLDMPRLGCVNVHGSLLPKWRGAAPIQRAVWAGDEETGVTIMHMDAGLDTGDMIHKLSCKIEATDTSGSMYDKLAQLGPKALIETLDKLSDGTATREKQDDALATHAQKLSKEEAKLDWSLPAIQLERCIRAFNPWPMSYFEINEQPVKVWQADVVENRDNHPAGTVISADKHGITVATAKDALRITKLQPSGKKPMSAQDVLNSRRDSFIPGSTLA